MSTLKSLFLPAFFLGLLFACGQPVDIKLMLGDWKGAEWLVEGQTAQFDATSASFSFRDGGTYTYRYSDMEETGTYYVSNNQLFTTPEGGIKMMVKIEKLTADSLVMNMNRGGTAETLTLVR